MPNIKSAKKRVKVIEAKTLQNKIVKTQLHTAIKKFETALQTGDKEATSVAYRAAVKKIDQAVNHGVMHKNKAAHKKSELTLAYNKL